ncbi:uncharacterized protein LOC128206555 [Mya arenaria]|uniref:uncharacterized protein LOC128206555 n=1 Tax=Mya arenaria TaxID=6604 RepID=UPI0022E3AD8D|nr:uncharacterized protein LOC128206555 [Mya arenaria]
MDKTASILKDTLNELDTTAHNIAFYKSEAQKAMGKHRDSLIAHITKLFDDLEKEVELFSGENEQVNESLRENASDLNKRLDSVRKSVNNSPGTDIDLNKLFIRMMKSRTDLNLVAKETGQGVHPFQTRVNRYQFIPSKESNSILENLHSVGTISKIVERPNKVKQAGNVNVRMPGDASPWISGLTLLSNNRLVAADCKNRSLKLVDLKYNRIIKTLTSESSPWDVTTLSDNQIAVTYPHVRVIHRLNIDIDGTFIRNKVIKTRSHCYGLVYSNGTFIVSFEEPNSGIEIIDMEGGVVKTLCQQSDNNPMFTSPWFLTFDPDIQAIVVSDCKQNIITSLNLNGDILCRLKDDLALTTPRGVCLDRHKSLYICGSESNTLCQAMDSNRNSIYQIIDRESGILNRPWAICYDNEKDQLIIGDENTDLRVFQIYFTR